MCQRVRHILDYEKSTSRTLSRQESHCSTSSSSSSSPTVSEIQIRAREDRIESDTSPVTVSTKVNDRSEQPVVNQANKIPQTPKKEPQLDRGNPLCSEIPEWLQEFREHLVDDEIPLQGGSHASSSHEVSFEPTRIWVSTVFILISLKTEIAYLVL